MAGRSAEYANTLGSVLLPDMLIVQTDKDPATAGWLTWLPLAPFANGYGGRKLGDDVVDLALLAVFGDPFGADPDGAAGKEALTTDNVGTGFPGSVRLPLRRSAQLSRPLSLRRLALVVPLLGAAGAASALSGRWARAEASAARLG